MTLKGRPPDLSSRLLIGLGEFHHHVEAPLEGVVEIRPQICCKDGDAVEGLNSLQEVGDLDVRVTVARV